MSSAVDSVTSFAKKAVKTVTDPFDVGYGDALGDALTLGLASDVMQDAELREGEVKEPVAPVPDDEESRRARERRFMRRYAKAGRAGTVLSRGSGLG